MGHLLAVGGPGAVASPKAANPIKQQRKRAARLYVLRVLFVLLLMGGVAYAAWFAPGSRHAPPVRVEAAP